MNFFSELSAHKKCTVAVRNGKFRALLKLPQFSDLNRRQIKGVYNLYEFTINLKQLIARLVTFKTDEIVNDQTKSTSIDSMIVTFKTCIWIRLVTQYSCKV